MSIAQSIVEIVEETLRAEPGTRVERVVVRIGRLVAVGPDSLAFCYEAITEGTALAGSDLVVEEVPVRVRCRACGETTELETFTFRCARCGGVELSALSGNELVVSHIEVEQ
ncbi:MAG: hydrogenase maturation nickel metallochaperone HypA [Gemmatimonadota bacterium]|nr:hydrogenase maturation nickel metallochaperone HypA [Gemmatimonadota bacterium]